MSNAVEKSRQTPPLEELNSTVSRELGHRNYPVQMAGFVGMEVIRRAKASAPPEYKDKIVGSDFTELPSTVTRELGHNYPAAVVTEYSACLLIRAYQNAPPEYQQYMQRPLEVNYL
jgi:hypothetical protein